MLPSDCARLSLILDQTYILLHSFNNQNNWTQWSGQIVTYALEIPAISTCYAKLTISKLWEGNQLISELSYRGMVYCVTFEQS